MTAHAAVPAAPRRLLAASALELRVQTRYGVLGVAVGLGAVWSLLLLALPAQVANAMAPFLLFIDTATLGTLLAGMLLLFERAEGARAALSVSPLRPGEYAGVKTAVFTAFSLAAAVPIILTGARARPGSAVAALPFGLLGVALTSALFVALAIAIGARRTTLQGLLAVLPPVLVPLLVVPVGYAAGVLDHPAAYLVPTTTGMELIRLGADPASARLPGPWIASAVGYLLVWVAAALVLARRACAEESDPDSQPGAPPRVRARRARGLRRRVGGAVAAFARTDLRGMGRDVMLLAMVAAPVLLALGLRFGYPWTAEYLSGAYGFELASYRPVAFAALILLHVPMMVGAIGGLRVIDDVDDRTLLALRVSPFTLGRYFAYRAATVFGAAALGLAAAVPLCGLAPEWSWALLVAILLAAGQAVLLMLVVTAFAVNKVEATVVVKAAGAVMALLPLAVWWLPGPAGWVLLALPPSWPLYALPGYGGPSLPLIMGFGVLTSAVAAVLLLRRTRDHLADTLL